MSGPILVERCVTGVDLKAKGAATFISAGSAPLQRAALKSGLISSSGRGMKFEQAIGQMEAVRE